MQQKWLVDDSRCGATVEMIITLIKCFRAFQTTLMPVMEAEPCFNMM
jgi:hypothetical protein